MFIVFSRHHYPHLLAEAAAETFNVFCLRANTQQKRRIQRKQERTAQTYANADIIGFPHYTSNKRIP